MALQDAINWIASQVATVTGIKTAQAIPTDGLPNVEMWAAVIPGDGTFSLDSKGSGRDLHNVRILVGTSRGDLQTAMYRLVGVPEGIADKLRADPTLGATVATFDTVSYVFAPGVWNDIPFLGYVLTVTNIKLLRAIT